jgi:hypothetical protein
LHATVLLSPKSAAKSAADSKDWNHAVVAAARRLDRRFRGILATAVVLPISPIYGVAVVAAKQGDSTGFVALTIVIAQAVMIGVSLIAMRMAEKEGY